MMKGAQFTAYGRTEDANRVVRFFKRNGMYVCEVEGVPSLTITHPSHERVKAAFDGWYQMSLYKDYGASDIEWGDMLS